MGTDARGIFSYAIFYCGLLLVLAPLPLSAKMDQSADAKCIPVKEECPKTGMFKDSKGNCTVDGNKFMLDCKSDLKPAGGICVHNNDCLGTWFENQDHERVAIDPKADDSFFQKTSSGWDYCKLGGSCTEMPSGTSPDVFSPTSPSDVSTHVDGAFDPLGGESPTGGLKSGESILQQVEKYIDPLGGWGEPDFLSPEGAPSGQFSSPDLDNAVSQTQPPSSQISFPGQETPEAPYTAESTFEPPQQTGQPPADGETSKSQTADCDLWCRGTEAVKDWWGDINSPDPNASTEGPFDSGIDCANNPSSCPPPKTGAVSWYNCGTGGDSGPCVGTRDNPIDPRDYTVASAFPDNTVLNACTKNSCVAVVSNDKGGFLDNPDYSRGNRVGDLSRPAFQAIADPKLGLEQGVIKNVTLSPVGMYGDYQTAKAVASSINNSMVYDLYGESIGRYDVADASLQNYYNEQTILAYNQQPDSWPEPQMVDQLPGGGFDESGFAQFADQQADFAFNAQSDVPFPEEETIPLPLERPTETIQNDEAVNAFNAQPDVPLPEPTFVLENPYAISPEEQQAFIEQDSRAIVANDQAARSFGEEVMTVPTPEPTYVFENPYAISPEEQQAFIEQDSRAIVADAENERAVIALDAIDAADWPEPRIVENLDEFTNAFALTPEEQQTLVNQTSQDILADEQRIADYHAQSILNNFYNPLVPTDSQRQALVDDMSQSVRNIADLDNFAPADQLVSHNQIAEDIANDQAARSFGEEVMTLPEPPPPPENEPPYPAGTIEEAPLPPPPAVYDLYGESIGNYDAAEAGFQNYNYFTADNTDAWNAVALNENNADFFYGDNAAEWSVVASNENLFSDNTGVPDESLTDLSNDIANDQAARSFGEEAATVPTPEPTFVFENPYAISPEDQQAFIEQDSRAIVADAENERAQIALNTIDAADWPEPRIVENLDEFTNAFALTPEEQQTLVNQTSQDILDQQADFAFNQQPDVPFPEEETIPLPPQRPTEAIQNDEAVNAFNAQPSTEDFNAQESYDAWQSFYAQPSAEDVAGQETADANQAFNAQYDAELPEPQIVDQLPGGGFDESGFEQFADQQADLAFNQQPDSFPEEETIPLPPERPTEAIQNDEAVNAFNAQPSTEDFNAQESYDAWQSFYAQPSTDDVAGQETADADQAFNAQYDAELPEPKIVDQLPGGGFDESGFEQFADQQADFAFNQQPDVPFPEEETIPLPPERPAKEPAPPETKDVPLPTPAPQPKEITPPAPPETKDVPPPPVRPPTASPPKVIAPQTPTQPPVPVPLPRPQIRPPTESTPQGEAPSAPSGGSGGIGGILSSLGQTFGQMLGALFGGGSGQGGSAAGQTFAQNTYCITNIDPLVVQPVPARTPFPSGCYNNPLTDGVPLAPRPPTPVQPSPAPAPVSPTPPSPTPTPPTPNPSPLTPVVTIISNPNTVAVNGIATIAWSSVGTTKCTVSAPNGSQIGASVTDGKATTSPLTTSTTFSILCTTTAGGTISGQTTVKVKIP